MHPLVDAITSPWDLAGWQGLCHLSILRSYDEDKILPYCLYDQQIRARVNMSHRRRYIQPVTKPKQSPLGVHKIPDNTDTNTMLIEKVSLLLPDVNLAFSSWRHSMVLWVQQLPHIPTKRADLGDYLLLHKSTRVCLWMLYCWKAVCKHRDQTSCLHGVSGWLTNTNIHLIPPSALPHPSFTNSMPLCSDKASIWTPSDADGDNSGISLLAAVILF